MEQQKCQNCSAPMVLTHNRDGTDSYKCNYCGNIIDIRPKTASDKVFSLINRAVNALKDEGDPFVGMSPEKKAEMEQRMAVINQKRQQAYEKYQEKRMKAYEKYIDKKLNK